MRKLFLTLFFSAFFVSGCNTIEGIGEDLQTAGEAISNKAEEVAGD